MAKFFVVISLLSISLTAFAQGKTAVCTVCGPGIDTGVPHSLCSKGQKTGLLTFGTERTLHFGRYEVEVWGIPKEQTRIRIYDTVLRAGAEGQIDSKTNKGYVAVLDPSVEGQVTGGATCEIKIAKSSGEKFPMCSGNADHGSCQDWQECCDKNYPSQNACVPERCG